MIQEHYLDNAATTRVMPEEMELLEKILVEDYGNPSSLHRKGQMAERHLMDARQKVASILKTEPKRVFFTSCATESINTALRGAALKQKRFGRHILTSKGEHAAVRETLKDLENQGFEIEYLEQDASGRILESDLEEKLRDDTILVTLIHVNNETGCIQPVDTIGSLIRQKSSRALFHVDATQSFCKYPLYPDRYGIDLLSASGHKINAPKGIGLLYKGQRASIGPLLSGGGQESGFRSGTENVAFAACFAFAASTMWEERAELMERLMSLKRLAWEELKAVPDVFINGPSVDEGAAHILSIRVSGVRSEVLLHALEDDGIYVSSGSACSSNKPEEKSPTLHALGFTPAQMDETIRISFGRYTAVEDVMALSTAMKRLVPVLRRFSRK